MKVIKTMAVAAALGASLSGCAAPEHLNADFGSAVRQDRVSQITDSEASRTGAPPLANGVYVSIAQDRYATDTVIKPIVHSATLDEALPPPPTPLPPVTPPPPLMTPGSPGAPGS